jgi:hypothetical protein
MIKTAQIKFWKKQLQSSRELKEVANQNLKIATRLEAEAKKALEVLGNISEPQKKSILDSDLRIKNLAQLTKSTRV